MFTPKIGSFGKRELTLISRRKKSSAGIMAQDMGWNRD